MPRYQSTHFALFYLPFYSLLVCCLFRTLCLASKSPTVDVPPTHPNTRVDYMKLQMPRLQSRGVKRGSLLLQLFRSMDELVAALHGADAVVCCVGFRPTYIPQDDRRLAQEIDNFGVRGLTVWAGM